MTAVSASTLHHRSTTKESSVLEQTLDRSRHKNNVVMQLDMHMNCLYGREEELKSLHQLVVGGSNSSTTTKIGLVHGPSGVGKTALCHEFARSLKDCDVYFMEGKYDQYTGVTSPYSAIISAFDQLGKRHLPSHHEEALKRALTFEAGLLTKLVPSFAKYSDETSQSIQSSSSDALILASERLSVAFLSFLRSFCKNAQPVILFMDDLQWMDKYSQELLSAIVNDVGLENFVFVGGYRDDEASMVPVKPFVANIPTPTIDVHVDNLTLEAVNILLTGLLHCTSEETQPLADIIYRKTAGNPYFALQQLHNLHMQRLLMYNFASARWEWDMNAVIDSTVLSENVLDVVSSRIRALPDHAKRLLNLVACVGFTVDENVLQSLDSLDWRVEMSGSDSGEEHKEAFDGEVRDEVKAFQDALMRLVEETLLERSAGLTVKFSHDRIQQCVYEQIVARDHLHYRIGTHLRIIHSETPQDKILLLAVDQLNRSSSLIASDEECLSLIKLNYEASLIAKQAAGIENVAAFLRKATELVKSSFWRFHYDFVLEIFNSYAEVEFSLGRHEEASLFIEQIMEHACCEADTVRALVLRYQTLGHQRQFKAAIKEAYRILKLIGEPLPSATMPNIIIEYFKAQRETKNKTDEFFLDLPPATSTNVKIALKVLQIGSVYGWNSDMSFGLLAWLRAMRVTVRGGATEATAFIYSGFGMMLAQFGNKEQGFRFAQLSIAKGKNKESLPSASTLPYVSLTHLKKPIAIGIEPLLSGYRVGLECGDIFFGSIDISCYVLVYFSCGLPLGPLASDMRLYGKQLQIIRQAIPLAFVTPSLQLALNLLGESDSSIELSCESIKRNQQDMYREGMFNESDTSFLFLLYLQLFNAYVLEDASMVKKTMKRINKLQTRRFGGTHMMNYFLALMDGLGGLYLSKTDSESKREMRTAKKAITELKKMAKISPVNSITLLRLLEAEQATHSRSPNDVKPLFDAVIVQLNRGGYVHYNAIANELAGKFFLKKDEDWARHYLSRACFLYNDWGASVKVEQMLLLYPALDPPRGGTRRSSQHNAIQGQSRFSIELDSIPDAMNSSSRSFTK